MSLITPASDFIDERPETQLGRILSPSQLTQFEIDSIREEQRRLNYFTDKSNEEIKQGVEHKVFLNLSVVELFQRFATIMIAIMDELIKIDSQTTMSDFVLIFIKEDRLIYVGLLFIMIAISIYFLDLT